MITERKILENMNRRNLKKAMDYASELRKLFPTEKQYFALGGSLALRWMKLITRPIGDVDIMVSERAENFILFVKKYNELFGETSARSGSGGSGSPDANDELEVKEHLTLKNGSKQHVCVFVMKHDVFEKYIKTLNNIKVADPAYILKAKLVYLTRMLKDKRTYQKHHQDIVDITVGIGYLKKHLV